VPEAVWNDDHTREEVRHVIETYRRIAALIAPKTELNGNYFESVSNTR